MDFLIDPTAYADKLLATGLDPAEAEDLLTYAKAEDERFRHAPAMWIAAVIAALHTPR
jgi:hypothetical protein